MKEGQTAMKEQAMNLDQIKDALCKGEFSDFKITWNDMCSSYDKVESAIESDPDYYWDDDFVGGANEKAECIRANSIWTAHWYPLTPVSFHLLHASTFEKLEQGLMSFVKEQSP